MIRLLTILAAGAITVGSALPLGAADVTFSGSLDLRAGYGNNPYLFQQSQGGSPLVGGTLTGEVDRSTAVSQSSLTGSVDANHNFSHYGTLDNYLVRGTHTQNLNEHLVLSADASYQDSINPRDNFGYSTQQFDVLAIGQRTHTLSGDVGLAWQATARDSFQAGVNGSHTRYSNSFVSGYDQYGGTLGYLRTLDARTKVGLTTSYNKVESQDLPSSGSVYLGARLVRDFSAIWKFDGSIGVITGTENKARGGGTTLGGTAQLCGTYPRYGVCITAARQSAASGLGGLTTHTSLGATFNYDLSAHTHIALSGLYDQSEPQRRIGLPRQRYASGSAKYTRDITERIAVGATGQYQSRDFGSLRLPTDTLPNLRNGHANSYSVTGDLIFKFGRLK